MLQKNADGQLGSTSASIDGDLTATRRPDTYATLRAMRVVTETSRFPAFRNEENDECRHDVQRTSTPTPPVASQTKLIPDNDIAIMNVAARQPSPQLP